MSFPGRNGPLIAGATAALFAPVATFGFDLSPWVTLPASAVIYAGLMLALGPRDLFEGFSHGAADRDSRELARVVLVDATADLKKLEALGRDIRSAGVRSSLRHLHSVVARTLGEVEAEPRRVNAVRRLLTYYLPAAVRLGTGYALLERAHAPDPERLEATGIMLAKLAAVFGRHADRLVQDEVDDLDLEIRLLEEEIREEQRR